MNFYFEFLCAVDSIMNGHFYQLLNGFHLVGSDFEIFLTMTMLQVTFGR